MMQNDDVITNPRWRTTAILKMVISAYLSRSHLISMKSGVKINFGHISA